MGRRGGRYHGRDMAIAPPTAATEFETLHDLVTRRASVRKLKPDPIPDGYIEKMLETARWAMSGANSQPWEFIVVRDAQIKKDLWRAYVEMNSDFIYWMEQQRDFKLRVELGE